MGQSMDHSMLTANFVKSIKRRGHYHDGHGLYLNVNPTGGKFWSYRYRVGGRLREMGLGAASLFASLEEVRAKHQAARRSLKLDRIDPIEARNAGKTARKVSTAKTLSFQECADAYIRAHQ